MQEQPTAASRWDPTLLLGAGLLAVVAPLAVGGVHAPMQVGLSAAALALLFVHGLTRRERGLRLVPFAGAIAVALAFTMFQLTPLPAAIVRVLSAPAAALRADVAPAARLMPLTLDAPATWLALMRGVACAALLFLVGGIVQSRGQARRLLGIVAGGGAVVALVALAQRALGVQAILGVYRPRSTPGFGVFGSFVDVNHAAALLTLTALIAAGLALELRDKARAAAAGVAALAVVAILVSTSRSGAFGLAAGGFLMVTLLAARSVGVSRAVGIAVVLLMFASATALWASEGLRVRVWGHEQVFANQKTRGWVDGARMAFDYKWTGVGRGAFEAPVNAYRQDDESVRLVYPENIVVQMASEWGIAASMLLLALAIGAARRLAPTIATESTPAVVGAACGVVGVLAHDFGDFSLELPGVAFPTVIALGVVVGRIGAVERRGGKRGVRVAARAWVPFWLAAVLVLVAAAGSSARTLDADYAAVSAAARAGAVDESMLRAAIGRHPADDYLELVAAQSSLRSNPAQAMHHINRALRLHPANWQAHRLAARALLALRHPAQAALEYRLALATGMQLDVNELTRMLAGHVVEAVPQTPPRLFELARSLYGGGHVTEADAAARRAVDLAEERTAALSMRVQLAMEANATQILAPAARSLFAEADTAENYIMAARGLAGGGAPAEANQAIDAGLKAHPGTAALLLAGAELRLAGGDLSGARAMLGRLGRASPTLADRQRAEEILAQVSERAGDPEGAAVARARARLIEKKRHDMTFSGD
jgi:tetratricopeptide (TPR) repeat protein